MSPSSTASDLDQKLKIGTSGYVFDDWVGSFYPRGLARRDFLRFYAASFSVVEINATYYRIPSPSQTRAMAGRTPSAFRFVVKAHQDMTHRRETDPELYRRFDRAISPLREAGKLDGILLQFPFGFRNDASTRAHLQFLRRQFPGELVWAEFRHDSWNRKPVFSLLEDHEIGFCAVDEPALPGLMPPVCRATTARGYIRFHGRNAETWWGSDGHLRYDWEYSKGELGEWIETIRDLAHSTQSTYVFFNNCYMGRAVKGARLLRKLLNLPTDLELAFD